MSPQWTVTAGRLAVTLVSTPVPMPPMTPQQRASWNKGEMGEMPLMPSHLLISRPEGGEPIRVEGHDAELLLWMLGKLMGGHRHGLYPLPFQGPDVGMIGG